jgi:Kef-type K+ transport system membrane component KefB
MRPSDTSRQRLLLSEVGAYTGMLLAAGLALWLIYSFGLTLYGQPAATAWVTQPHSEPSALLRVLAVLAVIIVATHACGALCARWGQPAVIGEILGGILVGPSVFGWLAPDLSATLLNPSVMPTLEILGQLGIILYMFLIGLEFDPRLLRQHGHAAVMISHAGILMPLVAGCGLGLWLYPSMAPQGATFLGFTLFMGVAMAITAFPVLARILADRGLHKTTMGTIALACAAVDDATAWCLLALAIGCARADMSGALVIVGGTFAFVAAMVLIARPLLARCDLGVSGRGPGKAAVGLLLLGLILSAMTTEAIGIHALFGAFLFGAVLPRQEALATAFRDKLHDLLRVLLLPAFFALTGMRTEIGLLNSMDQWLVCLLIIAIAVASKCVGTMGAARCRGFAWRDAACLGVLMNTRGLMELIVLTIGLEHGIISAELFTVMVLMALITTLMTGPALQRIGNDALRCPA